jgi:ribosome-associated protein
MDIATLERLVVGALEDIKARDIEVIDTTRLTAQFERIVVASAESGRQTRALARNVQDRAREAGVRVLGVEGEDSGEWVLVDLGEVVVHLMQPAVRGHYRLEDLWIATPASRRTAAEVMAPVAGTA